MKMARKKQLLPEVEAIGDAPDKAQRRHLQKPTEDRTRIENSTQHKHGHKKCKTEDMAKILRSPCDQRKDCDQRKRPELTGAPNQSRPTCGMMDSAESNARTHR